MIFNMPKIHLMTFINTFTPFYRIMFAILIQLLSTQPILDLICSIRYNQSES